MQFIGNIVTKTKFEKTEIYNVVSDIKDIVPNIPTLIIGWDLTKMFFPNANILEHDLGNNVFWTFGKREKRDIMEVDLVKFKSLALSILSKTFTYTFFNTLTSDKEEKQKLIEFLNNTNTKTCYIVDDMAYLWCNNSEHIIGISLRDVAYEKGSSTKFVDMLRSNKFINFVESDNKYQSIKSLLKHNKYLLSYVFS